MLSKLKIGTRLIIAFILVASISAVVGLVGLSNSSTLNDLADALYDRELMGLSKIKEANINIIYIGRARANFLLATTQQDRDRILADIERYSQTARQHIDEARELFYNENSLALFREIDSIWVEYQRSMAQALSTAAAQDLYDENLELQRQLGLVREKGDRLDQIITELSKDKENNAQRANQEANALYASSRNIMIAVIFGGVLFGIALGLLISRSITRPLNEAVEAANRLADGDLSVREMFEAGAQTFGQDETSCVVYGMPKEAKKLGAVGREIPLEQIPAHILRGERA